MNPMVDSLTKLCEMHGYEVIHSYSDHKCFAIKTDTQFDIPPLLVKWDMRTNRQYSVVADTMRGQHLFDVLEDGKVINYFPTFKVTGEW